jgi:glycosyltransferase involved in cell wall biosynthesis
VCIAASEFTRQSLIEAGVPADRIKLLPLGADVSQFTPVERSTEGKFRILFVGGVGQRKGIKYLLEAYRRIRSNQTELVIAGPLNCSDAVLAPYRNEITLRGRLDQAAVVREMQSCHVLVLPSVFEGFGLVIPEAMATGMPVIASTHSVGPEMIREGIDGYVLAPDDVEGLAAKLDYLATHRQEAAEMGRQAAQRAQEFSWEKHAGRVAELIDEMWNEKHNVATKNAVTPR